MEIIGGQTKRAADVTFENGLKTLALAVSPQTYATYRRALAWTVFTTQTPTGAGDYFLYIANQSSVRDILVTAIRADIGTDDVIEARYVTGTPSGGSDVDPTNRAISLAAPLEASIQAGSDITGLTSGGVLERLKLSTTGSNQLSLIDRPILLPRARGGNALAFAAITGTVALNIAVDIAIQVVDPQEYVS